MNPFDVPVLYSGLDAPGSPGTGSDLYPCIAPAATTDPASRALVPREWFLDSSVNGSVPGHVLPPAGLSLTLATTMGEGQTGAFEAPADPLPQPAPTSLVLCSELVGEIDPETARKLARNLCHKRPQILVSTAGRITTASCDSYRCPDCGARKARTKSAIITEALRHPDCWAGRNRPRLLTLTKLPTLESGDLDYDRARGQIKDADCVPTATG
jgi:hypothetical protein